MQTIRPFLGVLLLALISSPTFAAQEKKPTERESRAPRIGEAAPDFELSAADKKTHRLSDYKAKTVVLEWISKDCPWSVGACPKLSKTARKYADQGVVWLAVDSSRNHTAEQNAEYARAKKLPYPILMDTDGKIGRAYGAKTTPHMFIISKGKLVYMGAHDNQAPGRKPKREYRDYVGEALDAVLNGDEIPMPETRPYGCGIKYAPRKP